MGFSGQEYWSRLPFPYLLAHRVAIVSGEKKLYDMLYWKHGKQRRVNIKPFYEKCWTAWSTSWNQDCQEKYQICRWHHPYAEKLLLSNCGAGKDSWESLGQQDQTSLYQRKSTLNIHWKGWCWSWSSNNLATWCKEPTHWKRPWCWKRLKAGRKGEDRGWDGWMESLTQWTWVWANSGRWWRTGKPGVLQFMGSQRVGHDWATKQ